MSNITRYGNKFKSVEKIFYQLLMFLIFCHCSGLKNERQKKYEHIVMQNWQLSNFLAIFIKSILKSAIRKHNLSSVFNFTKSGVRLVKLTL